MFSLEGLINGVVGKVRGLDPSVLSKQGILKNNPNDEDAMLGIIELSIKRLEELQEADRKESPYRELAEDYLTEILRRNILKEDILMRYAKLHSDTDEVRNIGNEICRIVRYEFKIRPYHRVDFGMLAFYRKFCTTYELEDKITPEEIPKAPVQTGSVRTIRLV